MVLDLLVTVLALAGLLALLRLITALCYRGLTGKNRVTVIVEAEAGDGDLPMTLRALEGLWPVRLPPPRLALLCRGREETGCPPHWDVMTEEGLRAYFNIKDGSAEADDGRDTEDRSRGVGGENNI